MAFPLLPFALGVGMIMLLGGKKKNGAAPSANGGPFPPSTGRCDLDAGMPATHQDATNALIANKQLPAATLLAAAEVARIAGFPKAAGCLGAEAARRGGPQVLPPGFNPLDPSTWPQVLDPQRGGPPAPGGQPLPPSTTPPPPGGGLPGGGLPGFPGGLNIPGFPGGAEPGPEPGSMAFTVRSGDRPFGLAGYYTTQGSRFRELDPLNPQLGAFQGGSLPYPNWVPGMVIFLPASWQPFAKPLPPTGL